MSIRKLLILLLLVSSGSVMMGQTITTDLDFSAAVPTQHRLNGFNLGPSLNEMFQPTPTTLGITDVCLGQNYVDYKINGQNAWNDLPSRTYQMRPATLRFPGGTGMNYYHLYEYTNGTYNPQNPTYAPGFGFQEKETSEFNSGDVIRKQYCRWDQEIVHSQQPGSPNFIYGFANFIESVEQRAATGNPASPENVVEVLYGVNLRAHFSTWDILGQFQKGDNLEPSDPNDHLNVANPNTKFELYYKETIDAIAYLKSRGVTVAGVEFGNELYFPRYTTTRGNVTATSYMDLAHIYTKRIKAVYPDMKVAVVTDPGNTAWNDTITSYSPAFYDAVVVHKYYNNDACITANNFCSGGCTTDVLNDRACRFDCGKCAFNEFTTIELPDFLNSSLNQLPADKKIWMTEWSAINPLNNADGNLNYMNTFLFASFVMEHLAEQLKFNATSGGRLEYSTHHRLGYNNQWSVVKKSMDEVNSVPRSHFYPYWFMVPLFKAEKAYHYNGVSLQNFADTSDVFLETFVTLDSQDYKGKVIVLFSNKTGSPLPLNIQTPPVVNFLGNPYDISTMGEASYLYSRDGAAGHLYDSFGETRFNGTIIDETNNRSLLVKFDSSIVTSQFVLPPFATGVIEIPFLDPTSVFEDDPQGLSSLRLYPNPATDLVYITGMNDLAPASIELFDLRGRIIRSSRLEGNESTDLSTEGLKPGLYFVRVTQGNLVNTLKLLKN